MIAGGGSNIMGTGVGEIRHTQPVLSVAMADNGTVFSGGCDGKGMMWTPSQGGGPQQPRQIAEVSNLSHYIGVCAYHTRVNGPCL
jgi:hypothetical protein